MFIPLLRSPWRAPVPAGAEPTSSFTKEGAELRDLPALRINRLGVQQSVPREQAGKHHAAEARVVKTGFPLSRVMTCFGSDRLGRAAGASAATANRTCRR